MFALNIKTAKRFFFDRAKIIERIGADRARLLRNVGGFVSKTAARSMRKKGYARKPPKNMNGKAGRTFMAEVRGEVASPPGTPPFTHSTDANATLRKILFIYDTAKEAMVVGPVALNQKNNTFNGRKMTGTVPNLHEFGCTQGIKEKMVGRKWMPIGKRKARPGQPVRTRKAKYPARPFMAPAVKKTQSTGKFQQLWFSSNGAG